MNINVILHNTYNLDRMKRSWSYRSLCVHAYCVYVDSYSFLHSVCVVLSTGPGWLPLGPPLLLLLLLYPYPPFDVSHIPFSATLIVFCNYFHCSAIVTCSSCTTLNKLVWETKRAHIREAELTWAQCITSKNMYATVYYKLKEMGKYVGLKDD